MLSYSLKRLLLSIPVLWFLITIVFLLSRLLPGTYGSESMYVESSGYNKSSQTQKDQAYQSYLQITGQDLPIFYFSVSTLTSPTKEITTGTGKLLEQLSWQYGDQDKALAYHKRLEGLATLLRKEQNTGHLPYLYKLQNTTDQDSLLHYTSTLSQTIHTRQGLTSAEQLHLAAVDMTRAETSFKYLIPSLQWHGISNQYHQWFMLLLKGDLGQSFRDARPVASVLWSSFQNTFLLILISMVLAFFIALELSDLMVRKTRVNWHKILLPILYIVDSIPLFVLSLILLVLFATPDFLQLFPAFGLGFHSYQPDTWYRQFIESGPYLVLPITCLVLANLPYLTNQIYRALADTMQRDFIRTARSKGLKESNIIRRHALRNALLPVITILSDFLPALVAGSVVIETIFAIPGLGRLLITSVLARDFPVIIGIVLMIALVKMASHLLADICYAQADPRVRKATAL